MGTLTILDTYRTDQHSTKILSNNFHHLEINTDK